MGTEQETKERESSRTSLHPGRANSGNLPVALHSKRQPISPSVATPSWLRPCRNEGVELEKRQRKLQLNIGVHSNSNAAGRGSGANAVGPSGAMSASAGNCGWWPTWCQGTLCFFHTHFPNGTFQSGWSYRYLSAAYPRTELFHLERPLVVRLGINRRRCP